MKAGNQRDVLVTLNLARAVTSVRNYKTEHALFPLYLLIAKMLFSLLNLSWVLVSLMLKSYLYPPSNYCLT